MIAPLDVCPSWERRLPVTEKTFAPQDVCPSVGRLPVWTFARNGKEKTFARQSFARHVKDVCPSRRLPVM